MPRAGIGPHGTNGWDRPWTRHKNRPAAFPSWEIAQEWVHLADKNSINSPRVHRFLDRGLPGPFTAMVIESRNRRSTIMSGNYHQRELKDLYRSKDVMFTTIGVICTFAAAIWFARFFTGWAGI